MFKCILLSTDFSQSASWAAAQAHHLCRLFGARLLLHHAYDSPEPDGREQALERLRVLRQSRFQGIDNVELIAAGSTRPYESSCAEAAQHGADLIVAGRHGEHTVAERLLGSTTERIVRHAPCSVWVTHPAQKEHLLTFTHILAGSDLSQQSLGAVATARALAAELKSFVTLINVYDLLPPLELMQEPYELHTDTSINAMRKDKLESLRKEHLDGVPAEVKVVRDKSTVAALCDYALENKASLMVVGTHGMTGLRRLLIGSVAERVVRHAPCSVLVARERANTISQ